MANNQNIEIERKFLVKELPADLDSYKSSYLRQAYISRNPTVRLREISENGQNEYVLTVKGSGGIKRQEFELELDLEQFENLWRKVEGKVIEKTRYYIPVSEKSELICELDVYHGELSGKHTVEVEFKSLEEAEQFSQLPWFGEDVSSNYLYSNSSLSVKGWPFE